MGQPIIIPSTKLSNVYSLFFSARKLNAGISLYSACIHIQYTQRIWGLLNDRIKSTEGQQTTHYHLESFRGISMAPR